MHPDLRTHLVPHRPFDLNLFLELTVCGTGPKFGFTSRGRYREGVSLMADRFKRGSAPGRARSEDQRPGSFKKGHKKLGGRQRGTPSKFSAEYKNHIFEAASRVGMDANGTQGIVGYFRWVARRHPRIFCGLLGSVMELQELEIGRPQQAVLDGGAARRSRGSFWLRNQRRAPVSGRSDRTQGVDAAANGTRSGPFNAEAHQKQGADAEGEPNP